MNCVAIETALRLRDAGFPRENEFNVDRMFYFKYPHQDFYHLMNGEKAYRQMQDVKRKSDLWDVVHAPTATELLPKFYVIVRDLGEWLCVHQVDIMVGITDGPDCFRNANPAEAAAQAWLYVNSK